MRFKLSSLLLLLTFLVFAIGLGYQFHLLRNQVADLKSEVRLLKNRAPFVVYPQTPPPNANSPFRLLNSNMIVSPSAEQGMKADEWDRKRRIERRLKPQTTPAPLQRTPLESRAH
ncbi:MAG TPA: hypothetical protein VGK58_14270 [Lacipirellulaceae bacterium]